MGYAETIVFSSFLSLIGYLIYQRTAIIEKTCEINTGVEKVQLSFKTELKPNNKQVALFRQHCRVARHAYKLDERVHAGSIGVASNGSNRKTPYND